MKEKHIDLCETLWLALVTLQLPSVEAWLSDGCDLSLSSAAHHKYTSAEHKIYVHYSLYFNAKLDKENQNISTSVNLSNFHLNFAELLDRSQVKNV